MPAAASPAGDASVGRARGFGMPQSVPQSLPQGHDWNYADGILGLGLPGTALPVPPKK